MRISNSKFQTFLKHSRTIPNFRNILVIGYWLLALSSYAQIQNPVKWEFTSVNKGEVTELYFKVKIDSGWHLYSQKDYGAEGPIRTSFQLTASPEYTRVDSVQEGKNLIKHMDNQWGFEIQYYENEAAFTQVITSKTGKPYSVKGSLEFMICNDSQCMPPATEDFEFHVTPSEETSGQSFWLIFITGFLGGLAALLTPCVFPMLPFTVSFFTKRSKTKAKGISNAIIYGISIIIIYVGLGLGITLAFGSDALNAFSTNIWFNLLFFVLLVVFAISFFGYFEITLPSSWINNADKFSERGGLIGIFFMAFTLSLVSFSCTGPLIGTLLVEAAVSGGIKGPFWGMFGFASALALPFGLFAAFPGWLNSLPKSGGWLNSVKVVLGFLELALALKFASNADLVIQAGIITREIFLGIWIIIFVLTAVYLLGWIKFPHDSELKTLSIPRISFAILFFAFSVYLVPGLFGKPLKLISGFPPPDFYSSFDHTTTTNDTVKKEHCPNGLPCFHDYNEALAAAKQQGKPLMIDFTGWACVNCRKMEEQVWNDPEVDKRLRNDVVLVSLYVDDKNALPEAEQTIKKLGDRDFKIKTIGNKWSYFQALRYQTNTQPQYILLDYNEQQLGSPTGYDPDIQKYINWLDEGKKEFEKRKASN